MPEERDFMPNRLEFQRKWDHQSDELVERLMSKLEAGKEKSREAVRKRLLQLEKNIYFDPQDKLMLLQDRTKFKNLSYHMIRLRRAAQRVEEEARKRGFATVKGGLFWNPVMKHLYVKNGERYVLYALDRRTHSRRFGQRRVAVGLPKIGIEAQVSRRKTRRVGQS